MSARSHKEFLTPLRPHLIRAHYHWIVENGFTPYALLDLAWGGGKVEVPSEFVQGGRVLLNLAPDAVFDLDLTGPKATCEASFSGVPHRLTFPFEAVRAIYAREVQAGLFFSEPEVPLVNPAPRAPSGPSELPELGSFKIFK